MSSCKENECIHCDTKKFLVEQFERMFLKFLEEKVDLEVPANNLKDRIYIISDIIRAIVSASFVIVEKFENHMKEKDNEFPRNFFFEVFIQILMIEMGERGLAYGISVPKEEFEKKFMKNIFSVDPTKLN